MENADSFVDIVEEMDRDIEEEGRKEEEENGPEKLESEKDEKTDEEKEEFSEIPEPEAEVAEEGRDKPGVRDGTGPYKGSYQRKRTGSVGKRKLAGENCPEASREGIEPDWEKDKEETQIKKLEEANLVEHLEQFVKASPSHLLGIVSFSPKTGVVVESSDKTFIQILPDGTWSPVEVVRSEK